MTPSPTTPTTQQTPTAAARKAADAIYVRMVSCIGENRDATVSNLAAMIDRETHLPQFIAACEAALVEIEWWHDQYRWCEGRQKDAARLIAAALAAAGGEGEKAT